MSITANTAVLSTLQSKPDPNPGTSLAKTIRSTEPFLTAARSQSAFNQLVPFLQLKLTIDFAHETIQ